MRRLFAGTVLVGLVVFGVSAAFAQTQYPPHASTAFVEPSGACGSAASVGGSGWQADSTVTITFDSTGVGSATTDGSGSFSTTIQIPNPASVSSHTVDFSGLDTHGAPQTDGATFTVTSCGAVSTAALAFTGSNYTGLYVGGAVALILVGLVLSITAARRRRTRLEI